MAAATKPERQSPSPFDGNLELLVTDHVPSRIRALQIEIAELEVTLAQRRVSLRRLLDTAVLYNVPLAAAPARENGNAAGPGGADGAVIRGVER